MAIVLSLQVWATKEDVVQIRYIIFIAVCVTSHFFILFKSLYDHSTLNSNFKNKRKCNSES